MHTYPQKDPNKSTHPHKNSKCFRKYYKVLLKITQTFTTKQHFYQYNSTHQLFTSTDQHTPGYTSISPAFHQHKRANRTAQNSTKQHTTAQNSTKQHTDQHRTAYTRIHQHFTSFSPAQKSKQNSTQQHKTANRTAHNSTKQHTTAQNSTQTSTEQHTTA